MAIYVDCNKQLYIDHEPDCGIWKLTDRACTCTVVFPFPMLSNWDGWLTATPQRQAEMQRSYRQRILRERYE